MMKIKHVFCLVIVLALMYFMTGDCKKVNAATEKKNYDPTIGYELKTSDTFVFCPQNINSNVSVK